MLRINNVKLCNCDFLQFNKNTKLNNLRTYVYRKLQVQLQLQLQVARVQKITLPLVVATVGTLKRIFPLLPTLGQLVRLLYARRPLIDSLAWYPIIYTYLSIKNLSYVVPSSVCFDLTHHCGEEIG